jgi:hypothetical protein
VSFTFAPQGLLLLSPLPDDQVRLVATVNDPAPAYDRAAIQELLDRRAPAHTDLTVREVVQSGPYRTA